VLLTGDEGGNLGPDRRVLQASPGHDRQSGQRRIADDRPALLSLRIGRTGAAKTGTITNQHLIGLLLIGTAVGATLWASTHHLA